MNIFELNIIATPVLGIAGGLTAVNGMSGGTMVAAGGLGFGVGIGLYFGVTGLGALVMKTTGVGQAENSGKPSRVEAIAGWVIILLMLALPYLSMVTARWLVGVIFA